MRSGDSFTLHNIEPDVDQHARTLIYRLDARVKLVCTVATIIATLLMVHWQTTMLIFISCLLVISIFKVPLIPFLKRLLYPLYIISIVTIIQPFTYGSTYAGHILIPVYVEGLQLSISIFMRCLAAVTTLNLLISTTSITKLLEALAWLRAPSVLVDTTLLMLRYLSVISQEASRIYRAQKARGYLKDVGYLVRLKSYGTLFGVLIVRSYERAIRIGRAMIARGYEGGALFTLKSEAIPKNHILISIAIFIALTFLIVFDRIIFDYV